MNELSKGPCHRRLSTKNQISHIKEDKSPHYYSEMKPMYVLKTLISFREINFEILNEKYFYVKKVDIHCNIS